MTTEELISQIATQKCAVVSGESGTIFYVDPRHSSKIVLVRGEGQCHILMIARSYRLDAYVMTYKDRVERKFRELKILICDVADIHVVNGLACNKASHRSGEDTDTQKVVTRILKEASQMYSSDVHFIVNKGLCRIRFRIKGNLVDWTQLSEKEGMALCATIYQSMCDVAEPTFRPSQAQRSRMNDVYIGDIGLTGARVNTRPLDGGFLMVLRLFYAESNINKTSLEQLGYLPEQCKQLEMLSKYRAGIVLISGATGSGKSITMKTVMDGLLEQSKGLHVLTLEDPPEYVIRGANQSPVMGDRNDVANMELVWGQAIADSMRLDPDIIMIGEVRDSISARMAFRAAMTGHLVWTTIHANTVMTIMCRLQDEGVIGSLLTDESILIGLVNQSLVMTLCEQCKIPLKGNEHRVAPDQLQRIETCCDINNVYINGDGCEACGGSSSSGRTVVAEIIKTSDRFMDVYRTCGRAEAGRYWLQQMMGLRKMDAAIIKINQGILSPNNVESVLGPLEKLN
ncbi:type ii secretion system protein [Salmonella enterica]|nr:type ii secretion system protein [Salmonella enterica]